MADERDQAADLSLQPPSKRRDPLTGVGRLGRRVSVWTTRGLLVGLIFVAGVGFGRQVLRWWAADRSVPAAAPLAGMAEDPFGDPFQSHLLVFGNQGWSVVRRSVIGDTAAAVAALRGLCRQALAHPVPVDRPTAPSESRLLKTFADSQPVEEAAGKWRLYQIDKPFPLLAGVQHAANGGNSLAGEGDRVVIWGWAIPTGTHAWTLYTFQPQRRAEAVTTPELPLPPESSRVLSVQVAGGGTIAAIVGPSRPETWKQFYDDWFARQGWQTALSWRPRGTGWLARYTAPQRGPADCVDICLTPNGHGRLTGLLMTSRRTTLE